MGEEGLLLVPLVLVCRLCRFSLLPLAFAFEAASSRFVETLRRKKKEEKNRKTTRSNTVPFSGLPAGRWEEETRGRSRCAPARVKASLQNAARKSLIRRRSGLTCDHEVSNPRKRN